MNHKRLAPALMIMLCCVASTGFVRAQEDKRPVKTDAPEPRAKNGRKLLTALDLMKVAGVSAPRISPDGTLVAYTVSETKMDKDKEWKSVSQVWVVTMAGGKPRQYTRGEKSASAPEWSPDGSMLAFLSDREKDGERQVWMMIADGGEAWAVTTHKGGVSGFRFSPDGKQLLLIATDQPTKDEEDRKKVKDDTMVIDHDIKMTHLWLWNIEKKDEKRLTEGNFTVSDPQWSPDGARITYTTRPTPKADDGSLSDVWVLTVSGGEKKKLVSDAGATDTARWSPNGEWIAYTQNPNPDGGVSTTYLYVIQATFATWHGYFRIGSTGKGLAFAQANKNTRGKGDYEDCMTGVDAMIAAGIADPDRLGAFGWSYGGYMTFWILTQTDRFKAVSPGAGLTNIYSMYSQNDIQRYLRWFYSDKSPWDAQELYWDRSPMKYVKNVKTPTMIMHGQVDTRVPIAQAQEFYQALREMNVPVEFVVYPRENHGFTEPRHQMDRVRRYVRFFAKYLNAPLVTEPAGQ